MTDFCPTNGPFEIDDTDPQEVKINAPGGDFTSGYSEWHSLATFCGSDDFPEEGAKVALSNARLFVAAKYMLEVLEDYENYHSVKEWNKYRIRAIEYAKTGVLEKTLEEKKVDALCKITDLLVDLMEEETDLDIQNVYSELYDNLCREQCNLMGDE